MLQDSKFKTLTSSAVDCTNRKDNRLMISTSKMGDCRRDFLRRVAAGILGTSGVTMGTSPSTVSAWTGRDTNSILNQARPADQNRLEIARVEPIIFRLYARNEDLSLYSQHYLMCRVETKEGIVGWGEGTNWPKVATIATEIEMVKPLVIGQSAWDIEKIWSTIYRTRNEMHGSQVQSALSAIDIALWDIVGQKLGVPLYKLLGGRVNDKLRIYTSYRWGDIPRTAAAYAKRTRELTAEGAVAGKYDPFFEPYAFNLNLEVSTKTIHEVAEMIRGIREGGPEFDICVEAHAKFNLASAGRIAKALEPYDPFWLEEPVPPENVEAMREIQRSTSIPIAAGERLVSRLAAREYLERQAIRVLQPDVSHVGGVTEFRKMAFMAESHFIPVAPHNANGPICLTAHLHIGAALSNFLILEEGDTDPKVCHELMGNWQDSRAYFLPPEGPGLGLKISDDFLREHRVAIDKAEPS
jgi:galactonate dehydratase